MKREFTATVYIFNVAKTLVLLLYHEKLKKWLPVGGHVEENELPSETALREAREESGHAIDLILNDPLSVERWNAKSIPRPYLILLEEIPAYKETPAHQHIDFVYLGFIRKENAFPLKEKQTLSWFSVDDLKRLIPDEEIFIETLEVLASIMQSQEVLPVQDQHLSESLLSHE